VRPDWPIGGASRNRRSSVDVDAGASTSDGFNQAAKLSGRAFEEA
jgi:hypothetical protein